MIDISTGKPMTRRNVLTGLGGIIAAGCAPSIALGAARIVSRDTLAGSANASVDGAAMGMMRGVGARQAAMFGGGKAYDYEVEWLSNEGVNAIVSFQTNRVIDPNPYTFRLSALIGFTTSIPSDNAAFLFSQNRDAIHSTYAFGFGLGWSRGRAWSGLRGLYDSNYLWVNPTFGSEKKFEVNNGVFRFGDDVLYASNEGFPNYTLNDVRVIALFPSPKGRPSYNTYRIGRVKCEDINGVVFSLVPCVKEGIPMFYEEISGNFYGNEEPYHLTIGPRV